MGLDWSTLLLLALVLVTLYSVSAQRSGKGTTHQRLARLERRMDFLFEKLDLNYQPPERPEVSPEVMDLIQQGKKIQAIKAYRERTGVGLAEAKDVVDELEAQHKAGST